MWGFPQGISETPKHHQGQIWSFGVQIWAAISSDKQSRIRNQQVRFYGHKCDFDLHSCDNQCHSHRNRACCSWWCQTCAKKLPNRAFIFSNQWRSILFGVLPVVRGSLCDLTGLEWIFSHCCWPADQTCTLFLVSQEESFNIYSHEHQARHVQCDWRVFWDAWDEQFQIDNRSGQSSGCVCSCWVTLCWPTIVSDKAVVSLIETQNQVSTW